ncbi:HEAT repeat domain-containing protein [bacterium]|nr:HEAT repeat domain-containing protein [bacterium]
MRKKYGSYVLEPKSKHPAADSLATEKFIRNREINIAHQKLEVSFDAEKEKICGVCSFTFNPVNDKLEKVTLDSVGLNILKVTLENQEVEFKTKKETLEISFGKELNSAQSYVLSVTYDVTSPEKGAFFIKPDEGYPTKEVQVWTQGEPEENRYWYPSYDAPNQKWTTEAIITVDEKFMALSNGKLLSETTNTQNHTKTFHWLHDVPHVSYLFNIAIGEFAVLEDKFDGIPVTYYAPKKQAEQLHDAFHLTPDVIKFFSETTGYKYPYAKYGQVVVRDFTWGGMENTTLTIMYDGILFDENAKNDVQLRAFSLLAHELAHQWFGDLITMKNWQFLWLNESFASYFDPLYFEHKFGKDEFDFRMLEEKDGYFGEAEKGYIRPIETNFYNDAEDMFDGHSYNKGACVLHTLRYTIGNELFFKGIRHYVQKHAKTCTETTDLKVAYEESTGINLDEFFNQWIKSAGHPKFEISYSYDNKAKLVKLTVKQTQETNEHVSLFKIPFETEIVTENGNQNFRLESKAKEQTFYLPSENEPKTVNFDPDGWLLCQTTFEKEQEELLFCLKNGRTILTRIDAAKQLGKIINKSEVIKALENSALNDSFYGVAKQSAIALGKIGTEEAKQTLFGLLENVKDSKVRVGVSEALGEFKGEDVYNKLTDFFGKETSYHVKAACLRSLAKANKEGSLEFLKNAYSTPSYRDLIASAALDGIFTTKKIEAIDFVKSKAVHGEPTFARCTALRVLGSFGDYFPEKANEIREYVEEFLKDKNMRVRFAVVDSLGKIGDAKAVASLEKYLANEPFGMLKRDFREAILKIRQTEKTKVPKASFEAEVNSIKDENKKLKEQLAELSAKLDGLFKK